MKPAPLPREGMLRGATWFYLFLTLVALGLALLMGETEAAWELARGSEPLWKQLAAGLVAGCGSIFLLRLMGLCFPLARELEQELVRLIGVLTPREYVMLALLSGVAEEALFRVTLLAGLGPLLSTLLFAVMHTGRSLAMLLWTLIAATLGALFAHLVIQGYGWTGAALAHVLINLVNLRRLARIARQPAPPADHREPPSSP